MFACTYQHIWAMKQMEHEATLLILSHMLLYVCLYVCDEINGTWDYSPSMDFPCLKILACSCNLCCFGMYGKPREPSISLLVYVLGKKRNMILLSFNWPGILVCSWMYVVVACMGNQRNMAPLSCCIGKERKGAGYHFPVIVFPWPGILVCSCNVCCTGMYGLLGHQGNAIPLSWCKQNLPQPHLASNRTSIIHCVCTRHARRYTCTKQNFAVEDGSPNSDQNRMHKRNSGTFPVMYVVMALMG